MPRLFRRWSWRNRTTAAVVIKRRLSSRTKLLVAGGSAAVLLAGANFLYDHGVNMAGFESRLAERMQSNLREENQRLRDENEQLRKDKARIERSLQMAEVVNEDVQKSVQDKDLENIKLREELNFYRNIISPADKKSGLRVQSLDVERVGNGSSYRYKLVLIQALKHERTLYGAVTFEVYGLQGGQNVLVRFPGPTEKPVNVNLKYFQDVEGKFELPRDFRPKSVKVIVAVAGGGNAVEALYDWPQGQPSP